MSEAQRNNAGGDQGAMKWPEFDNAKSYFKCSDLITKSPLILTTNLSWNHVLASCTGYT